MGRREASVGEQHFQLAPKEFDLLWELLDHRGLVLTRDQLLERVWGYTFAAIPGRSTSTCASFAASLRGVPDRDGLGRRLQGLDGAQGRASFIGRRSAVAALSRARHLPRRHHGGCARHRRLRPPALPRLQRGQDAQRPAPPGGGARRAVRHSGRSERGGGKIVTALCRAPARGGDGHAPLLRGVEIFPGQISACGGSTATCSTGRWSRRARCRRSSSSRRESDRFYLAAAQPIELGGETFGALVVAKPRAELHDEFMALISRLGLRSSAASSLRSCSLSTSRAA